MEFQRPFAAVVVQKPYALCINLPSLSHGLVQDCVSSLAKGGLL
jgi:hypothetical protein